MHQQIFRLIILPLAVICFGLLPTTQAQLPSPTPDGGYLNGNTAEGHNALFSLTTGTGNTAVGDDALVSNTMGNFNTANGVGALTNNTTGNNNTATGAGALLSNTTISSNVGSDNTADGFVALISNTTGQNNTATGSEALLKNTTGNGNNGIGSKALQDCTTGGGNNALGFSSLQLVTTGSGNTAIGHESGDLITSGSSNICIGSSAGDNLTTGDNNIDIGNFGIADEASTIRIGDSDNQTKTFIAGISGVSEGGTISVVTINTSGQLGTQAAPMAPVISSRRFKNEIKPMDKTSEAILALKPVTFRYKKEIDPERMPQFGLVAEDVEKVNPDLVARDRDGKPFTVRYDAVNAMLLNEFLKEHSTVQEQQREIDALKAQLKEQRALIQKVSDKVELNKPAPQTVVNN